MTRLSAVKVSLWASWLWLCAAAVMAGSTDLATSPLVTSAPATVAPNVLLMMDDSGSMSWTFMP
ncbi:hypothetical protein, partial [uncultured Thiodictyon sp.]|uniref:hypothetical protein n=1 Tax=uncultured Thiodictyon sp. TaxID=1846217 RepID=UPI0025EF5B14